jgi:hypothetical protein
MSDHELEKLLGGFAADTLTPEEKRRLYSAALQDQQLFNALADEQALKELLADPDVRRKLLASLDQKSASGAGGSLSWLDWFRRPAGLAFAGGLAAAALAVVLGTKIYQDSLKQAVQSVATEESKPVSPPVPAPSASQATAPQVAGPRAKAEEHAESPMALAKKDVLLDKMIKRERAAPQEQRASEGVGDSMKRRSEQDELSRQAEVSLSASGKKAQDVPASVDQKPAASSLPSAAVPESKQMQAPAGVPLAGAVASGPSARALFDKTVSEPTIEMERHAQMAAAEERTSGTGTPAEIPPREKKRAERSLGSSGKLQSMKQSVERPLGLRYSVIIAGPGGIDMEVDPTTPVGRDDAPRLAVQTYEDGYLSVLSTRPSSDKPTMLFPLSGDGRVVGRKLIAIALANVFDAQQITEQIRLLITFSRTARDIGHAQQADKNAPRLLIEQVDPSQPGAPAEQAVYVVNPDPAPAAYLSIEVPLSLRP